MYILRFRKCSSITLLGKVLSSKNSCVFSSRDDMSQVNWKWYIATYNKLVALLTPAFNSRNQWGRTMTRFSCFYRDHHPINSILFCVEMAHLFLNHTAELSYNPQFKCVVQQHCCFPLEICVEF